jgi:hypothetical protein
MVPGHRELRGRAQIPSALLTGTSVPVGRTLLVLLSPSTGFDTVIAIAVYRWSEHRARERGLLDQTTGS